MTILANATRTTQDSTLKLVDAIAEEFRGDTRPATVEMMASAFSAIALIQATLVELQATMVLTASGQDVTENLEAIHLNLRRVTDIVAGNLRSLSGPGDNQE